MKCQRCGGSGKYMREVGGYRPCEYCNGTGKIVQTNEEWFCGLTTEEKVKALLDLRERIRQKMRAELGSENKFHKGDYYREWLKEKRNA